MVNVSGPPWHPHFPSQMCGSQEFCMRKTSHAKRVRSIKPMPYEYGHPFFERVREGKRAREETSEEAREREREREREKERERERKRVRGVRARESEREWERKQGRERDERERGVWRFVCAQERQRVRYRQSKTETTRAIVSVFSLCYNTSRSHSFALSVYLSIPVCYTYKHTHSHTHTHTHIHKHTPHCARRPQTQKGSPNSNVAMPRERRGGGLSKGSGVSMGLGNRSV